MNIELTSRCVLACPACPRTWFAQTFNRPMPKQDLDLDVFEKFLDCDSGQQVKRFNLEGNHGDAIYYPRLFEFIDRFRSTKVFDLVTAGNRSGADFWENLADKMTSDDTVTFSIDGLEHNNHIYRVNSDWKSIITAVEIMSKSAAKIIWKTLIFSYNQHELDRIQELASNFGAEFVPVPTHRFGDERLRPTEDLVLTERLYEHSKNSIDIDPKCPDTEYISADGYYHPCCWIAGINLLPKSHFWKDRDHYNIQNHNLDQVRSLVNHWADSLRKDPALAYPVCQMHCKKGQGYPWVARS